MNKSGLTKREVDSAKDGEVKKGCLILTKEKYEERAFRDRKDFKFAIAKNLKSVSSYLFCGSSLQFAFMPEVESIADRAFENSSLTAVCFLKVRSAGDYSFQCCEELNQVFLPVCEELGQQCFYGCTKIEILDLPKVKKIGYWQFWGCSSLTDLIIPSVEEIGDRCFFNCGSLDSIDSKLDANKFKCAYVGCKQNKRCPICRGQLKNCLKRGNEEQNRLRIQKKMEEQKMDLLKDAEVEPVLDLMTEETKLKAQIQQKTKDEQIEDLIVKMQKKDEQMQEKDEQIEQIIVKLQKVEQQNQDLNKKMMEQNQQHQQEKEQHQQEISKLIQQQQLNMEKMEQKFNYTIQKQENSFDIKVERIVRKFENQEKENEELKNEFKNFVRLLADK